MKLVTFEYEGIKELGAVFDNTVIPLRSVGITFFYMNDLIRSIDMNELLSKKFDMKKGIPLENVRLCAPIPYPVNDVICLGLNYMDHAVEAATFNNVAFVNNRPDAVYFAKRVNKCVDPGAFINGHSDIVTSLDYEVELAFVISKECRNVKKEDAAKYVFGYTILNDMTARNVQTKHNQWYLGKSLDDFCPIGPMVVTVDELGIKPDLSIKSYVNGELRQNARTSEMIFDIPYIIEELSKGMTLKAGTIISTGTPCGVGMGMNPPKFLKPGDEIECVIEKIGSLKNIIV